MTSDILSAAITLMSSITWPFVALIVVIGLPFGILNKTAIAITESIARLFDDVRNARKSFDDLQSSIKGLRDSSGGFERILNEQIEGLSTKIEATLNETFKTMSNSVDAIKIKLQQQAREALDSEESEVADVLPQYEGDHARKNSNSIVNDPDRAMIEIKDRWEKFKSFFQDIIPTNERGGDQRAFGQYADHISKEHPELLTQEQAQKIAALHGIFKGYTRRQTYAADWLTQERLDSFLTAVDALMQEIDSNIKS